MHWMSEVETEELVPDTGSQAEVQTVVRKDTVRIVLVNPNIELFPLDLLDFVFSLQLRQLANMCSPDLKMIYN